MNREELELASMRAAFAQPDDAGDRGSCPAGGEIWDAVHGALPPDRLRQVVDHVAGCAACAESWRIALQFERRHEAAAPADRDDGAGTGLAALPAAAPRRRRFWLYGAAAAVAAAIVVAVVVPRQPGNGPGAR